MTDDTRVKAAVLTLHLDLVKGPTDQKVRHINSFITRSLHDIEPPTASKLGRYEGELWAAQTANFSPKSIAHLDTVAKETLT